MLELSTQLAAGFIQGDVVAPLGGDAGKLQPSRAAILIDGQNKTRYTMAFGSNMSRPDNRHSGHWNILLADGHARTSPQQTWAGVFTLNGKVEPSNAEACAMYNYQYPGVDGDPIWPK